MCPDWRSNPQTWCIRTMLQPTELLLPFVPVVSSIPRITVLGGYCSDVTRVSRKDWPTTQIIQQYGYFYKCDMLGEMARCICV